MFNPQVHQWIADKKFGEPNYCRVCGAALDENHRCPKCKQNEPAAKRMKKNECPRCKQPVVDDQCLICAEIARRVQAIDDEELRGRTADSMIPGSPIIESTIDLLLAQHPSIRYISDTEFRLAEVAFNKRITLNEYPLGGASLVGEGQEFAMAMLAPGDHFLLWHWKRQRNEVLVRCYDSLGANFGPKNGYHKREFVRLRDVLQRLEGL